MISGVILAAGLSRRMGSPKQLLKLGNKTLLEHVVIHALQTRLDEVVVVTGAYREDIKQALDGYAVKFVDNERYEEGQGTSVAVGTAAVSPEARGILFLLADQPFVCPEMMNRISDAFLDTGAPIVRAGENGHPVLFASGLREQLLQLRGDSGGRQIIERVKNKVLTIKPCPYFVSLDIDTVDQYRQIKALYTDSQ